MGVELTDLSKIQNWYAHVRGPGQVNAVTTAGVSAPAGRADVVRLGHRTVATHADGLGVAFTAPGARGPPTREQTP
ncbi:hypothetical protein [Acrocarpospora corrugata]